MSSNDAPNIQLGADEATPSVIWRLLCFVLGGLASYGAFLALSNVIVAKMGFNPRPPAYFVSLELNETGGRLVGDLTRKNLPTGADEFGIPFGRHLAIVLDGAVVAAPQVNGELGSSVQIRGAFRDHEADHLVNVLRSGSSKAPGLKPSSVEFLVLANHLDDSEGISDSASFINSGLPDVIKALEAAQLEGLPPPVSLIGEPKLYNLQLTNDVKSRVSYSWVELGPTALRTLMLDVDSKDGPRDDRWKQLAKSRGKAVSLADSSLHPERKVLLGALIYGRECKNRNLTDKERAKKEVEFFVLARDPEIDPATGKPTPRSDGNYVKSASKGVDQLPGEIRQPTQFTTLVILGSMLTLAVVVGLLLRRFSLHWAFVGGFSLAFLYALYTIIVIERANQML